MNKICILVIGVIFIIYSDIISQAFTNVCYIPDDIPQIEWISLSYDGYDKEKEAIVEFLKEGFDVIKKVSGRTPVEVPIAVGCYDLNNDGVDEIIAFISDTMFHGAKSSGGLFVFKYDGKTITSMRSIAGFPLDTSTLDDPKSKQIGIIKNEGGWDYLYIYSVDLKVHGSKWETEIDP